MKEDEYFGVSPLFYPVVKENVLRLYEIPKKEKSRLVLLVSILISKRVCWIVIIITPMMAYLLLIEKKLTLGHGQLISLAIYIVCFTQLLIHVVSSMVSNP